MKHVTIEAPAEQICEMFFNRLLPRYLEEVTAERVPTRGILHCTLLGRERCTWTVDLDQRRVRQGTFGRPDAQLRAYADEWVCIIMGCVDWDVGFRAGRIQHIGNPTVTADLFAVLAALVVPPMPVDLGAAN